VIVAAVFCPHPPLLIPEVARGAAPEMDHVRRVALNAVETAVVAAGRSGLSPEIVLIGAGPQSAAWSALPRVSLAGFGVRLEVDLGAPDGAGTRDVPLSLTVGAWLVRTAIGPRPDTHGFAVGPDFGSSSAGSQLRELVRARDVVLVVMGDGSARRATTAPGYLDERAIAFDDAVAVALGGGAADDLAAMDLDLARDLLAAGAPAWHAAGSLLGGAGYRAELLAYAAPYGVGYLVAQWLPA
jgi:hypothetical protein